jgi:hypothetical protein
VTLSDVLPLVEQLTPDELAELHQTTGRWLDERDDIDADTARILDERAARADSDQWSPWDQSMQRLRRRAADLGA